MRKLLKAKALGKVAMILMASTLLVTGCSSSTEKAGASNATSTDVKNTESILQKVKDRGKVYIGCDTVLPGFGFLDSAGKYSGFDIEMGRAFAAAIFGDPNAAEMKPVTGQTRFTALQTGEIDILSRATTMTITRDTTLGVRFLPTDFYDGQGVMAHKSKNVKDFKDLNGMRIGVEQGTTTEKNMTTKLSEVGAKANIVVFENQDGIVSAYEAGSIDAWTSDKSGLVSRLAGMKNPADHVILKETLSKEPLTPVIKAGDDQWFNVTRWIVYALIQAEEFGITQDNVESMVKSENPAIRGFLGAEGDLGKNLGLGNDWVVKLIKGVGNYGEIYERTLGQGSTFKLERGINALWTDGGLMYAPPFN